MSSLYQELILEHSARPRNFGRLPTATHKTLVSNPLCGDELQMEAQIADGVMKRLMFTGKGCAISKASASLLTEAVTGKKIDVLKKWKKEDMIQLLHIELGPNRMKCALLAWEGMLKLIGSQTNY